MKFLILLCLTTLGLLSCELRRPEDGYDPNWQPDHEAPAGERADADSAAGMDRPGSADDDLSEGARPRRPSEIAADTSQMTKTFGTWEMVGVEKSDYTAYWNRNDIEMIIEELPKYTATYYFNQGALFYYHEESDDGSTKLTVEFDDIGDILGARKTVDGEPAHANVEDYADIVEHAVELKIAAEN